MPWTPTRYGLPSPGPHDKVEPLRVETRAGEPMAWDAPKVKQIKMQDGQWGHWSGGLRLFGSEPV